MNRKTKIHKLVISVIDFDDMGIKDVISTIENARYPNRCISPSVVESETAEVDWSDEHPLNYRSTSVGEFKKLFPIKYPVSDSLDFIQKTNKEYNAWAETKYTPEFLAEGTNLYGLWAWQEQERRKQNDQKSGS